MPFAPKRKCTYPGCSTLIERGQSRCNLHPYPNRADRDRRTSSQRGYNAAWQKIRAARLFAQPLCHDCAERGIVKAATEVHHITPLSDGGTHDDGNLMSLCRACHQRRTNESRGAA